MNTPQTGLRRGLAYSAGIALLLVGLVAVNVLAGLLPVRFDVTDEGLYTLSDGSKSILAKFEEPVTVKFYFSESLPDVPVNVKTFSRKVRELLEAYESASGGKLNLEVYDPKPDTDEEEWARRYGLNGIQLPRGTSLFFGMVALSGGREATVPVFDPRREKFLEYDISQALTRVRQAERARIGVFSSLDMGQPQNPFQRQPNKEWAFVQELGKTAKVEYFYQEQVTEFPENLDVLILLHPKSLTPKFTYAVDQFLLRGGRLMVFVDPHSRIDPGDPRRGGLLESNLPELFKAWGLTFKATEVVADQALATRVSARGGVLDFPLWITLRKRVIAQDSVITNELEDLTLIDAGAIEPVKDFKYKFTPLLTTSPNSGTLDNISVRVSSPTDASKAVQYDNKTRVLAGLISGTFASAFPGGPPPEPKKDKKAQEKNPTSVDVPRKLPHLVQGEKASSVLVVADSDFINDRFAVQRVSFLGQGIMQPINDNLNFVLNAAEFLTGSRELIDIRSRGQFSRPFERVADLQVRAQQQYQAEEQRLSAKLADVRKRLEGLEKQKEQGKELILTPSQLEEIRSFRQEEQRTRRALREVRKVLRQDIESLGNSLLLINLLLMPLLVALAGFVVIVRRNRHGGGKS